MTNIKGLDVSFGPVLANQVRAHRDELIMAHMYGLEILIHRTEGRPSTEAKLRQAKVQYSLNDHVNVVLGIGPHFFEPVKDYVTTDPKHTRETSDLDEDDDPAEEPPLHIHGAPTFPPANMEE